MDAVKLEPWKHAFRSGFAPELTRAGLLRLRQMLADGDDRLIQGMTTVPPPMMCCMDWPVEGACPVGQCGVALGLETVGEVETYFTAVCKRADARLGGPAECRYWLNWYDDTPREEVALALIPELDLALRTRNHLPKPEGQSHGRDADDCVCVGVGDGPAEPAGNRAVRAVATA